MNMTRWFGPFRVKYWVIMVVKNFNNIPDIVKMFNIHDNPVTKLHLNLINIITYFYFSWQKHLNYKILLLPDYINIPTFLILTNFFSLQGRCRMFLKEMCKYLILFRWIVIIEFYSLASVNDLFVFQSYYDEYRSRVADSPPRSAGASKLHVDAGIHDIQHVAVRCRCPRLCYGLLPLRMAWICRCRLHRTLPLIHVYDLWTRLVLSFSLFYFYSCNLAIWAQDVYKYHGVFYHVLRGKPWYKYFGQHLYQLLYTF